MKAATIIITTYFIKVHVILFFYIPTSFLLFFFICFPIHIHSSVHPFIHLFNIFFSTKLYSIVFQNEKKLNKKLKKLSVYIFIITCFIFLCCLSLLLFYFCMFIFFVFLFVNFLCFFSSTYNLLLLL